MSTAARLLLDYAKVIRSKNAGPFEITFDVMFADAQSYEAVKNSGAISVESIARAYRIDCRDVLVCTPFDAAQAIKITIRRAVSSGDLQDRDVYGCQQHIPLTRIVI